MGFFELINFFVILGSRPRRDLRLAAIGITLVFAIMRHGHLAHGDLATFGAFMTLLFATSIGIPSAFALPFAALAAGGLAILIDKLFYAHLRSMPKIITTIASLGVALMIRAVVQIVWGVNTHSYTAEIARAQSWEGCDSSPMRS